MPATQRERRITKKAAETVTPYATKGRKATKAAKANDDDDASPAPRRSARTSKAEEAAPATAPSKKKAAATTKTTTAKKPAAKTKAAAEPAAKKKTTAAAKQLKAPPRKAPATKVATTPKVPKAPKAAKAPKAPKEPKPAKEPKAPKVVKVIEGPLAVPERKERAGEVYAFGSGETGQLGMGEDVQDAAKPKPVPDLKGVAVVDVAVGGLHNLALTADGKVYSWGCGDEGALGRPVAAGEENDIGEIPDSQTYDFVKLAAGGSISLGLTASGQVYAWGTFRGEQAGKLGFRPGVEKVFVPELLDFPDFQKHKFVDIAAGDNHALALTSTGLVYAWGNSEQGQTGFHRHRLESGLVPMALKTIKTTVKAIACGSYHSLCIDEDGDVWTFGANNFGQCARHESEQVAKPEMIRFPDPDTMRAAQVDAGEHHSLVLLEDGRVLAFGRTDGHELGLGFLRLNHQGELTNDDVFDTYKDADGTVTQHKRTKSSIARSTVISSLENIAQIAAGTHHNIAVDKAGKAYHWGTNINSQLGNGSDDDVETPQAYDFSKSGALVVQAGCGAQHSVLLIEKPGAKKPAPASAAATASSSNANGAVANGHANGKFPASQDADGDSPMKDASQS
ncbi:hypothetical protein GGF31_005503 [Allomyces arbusculus]|nr:hypothetical protein GGF31_005503 [Allomyces arbusculus]